jgi:hypothetical protein
LPLECGATGTMLGHGFHPLKARHRMSILSPQSVHPHGRTPDKGQNSKSIDTALVQK